MKTLEKTRYYSYRDLCKIAKSLKESGYKITGKMLCDLNCTGAYGVNVNNKLHNWL